MSKVSSGSLRLSGNAFQTDGLATVNARQPNVIDLGGIDNRQRVYNFLSH